MRITYYTLNEYAIVPVKNMLNGVNCVSDNAVKNLYALCVPFYGSLEFLDLELRPFKSWNVDNPVLIDDIKKNNIINQPTGVSIYDLMYGINKFAKVYYSNNLHHGLEKAGVSAKETSKIIQDKVKDTKGKAKLHLVPQQILYDIAEVREYGVNKYPEYGEDNWKYGDPKNYLDAAYRHLTKMVRDGIDSKDEESGIDHYKHLATNIAFICGFMGGEHEDVSGTVEE